MCIAIDTLVRTPRQAVLKVFGRLAEHNVGVLDGEVSAWLSAVDRLVLDLKEVSFIDYRGLACLQKLTKVPRSLRCRSRRARVSLSLRDGSRFLRLLLETHGMEVH